MQGQKILRCVFFFFFFVRSHYFYSYLDARFYDDEMLTVVLQGSEELNAMRVLAQIPISSSLSCETEFNWEPNLRFVFTNFFDLSSSNLFLTFKKKMQIHRYMTHTSSTQTL